MGIKKGFHFPKSVGGSMIEFPQTSVELSSTQLYFILKTDSKKFKYFFLIIDRRGVREFYVRLDPDHAFPKVKPFLDTHFY